jgi:hypothetical protein
MVNWRENVEFIYGLAIVIAVVVVYFQMATFAGTTTPLLIAIVVGVIGAVVGFAAFESEFALKRWDKLAKK